ncbi:hypothetical protein EJ06DRAFT_524477 [Trichodelitschia bisporula]|uniref:Uncharacterized protein n=1 Tax=Trichodelitschia bisporula TaxID=703511 RepID=A0A6G1HKH4_9PEZI|nr:hypothetical protein EJ06DRAFT_524477 [Trichodelitschia bisporula]
MALRRLNTVHIALFSRDDLHFPTLLQLNNIRRADCPAIWHDARPDWAAYSTDERAERAAAMALEMLQSYVSPVAVVVSPPKEAAGQAGGGDWDRPVPEREEDTWFARPLLFRAARFSWSVIRVPRHEPENLQWVARLPGAALAAWSRLAVEVVIRVPRRAPGLVRLLTSLYEAEYAGLDPPRITLDLDSDVGEDVLQIAGNFVWPPVREARDMGGRMQSGLVIKRRVKGRDGGEGVLEVFPTEREDGHVLIFPCDGRLDRRWYYWVAYQTLRLRFDGLNRFKGWAAGVALAPPRGLNESWLGRGHGEGTATAHSDAKSAVPSASTARPAFFFQAPTADGMLFFGDAWRALQAYSLLRHTPGARLRGNGTAVPKLEPGEAAWLRDARELWDGKGWAALYPPAGRGSVTLLERDGDSEGRLGPRWEHGGALDALLEEDGEERWVGYAGGDVVRREEWVTAKCAEGEVVGPVGGLGVGEMFCLREEG